MAHRLVKSARQEDYHSSTSHNPGQSFYQLAEYREQGDTGFKQNTTERIWSEVYGFGKYKVNEPRRVEGNPDLARLPVWERVKVRREIEKAIETLQPKRRRLLQEYGAGLLEKNCLRCQRKPWTHMVSNIASLLCTG